MISAKLPQQQRTCIGVRSHSQVVNGLLLCFLLCFSLYSAGLYTTDIGMPKLVPGASWKPFWLSSCSLANTGPREPSGSHFGCPAAPWPKLVPGSLLEAILAVQLVLGQNWFQGASWKPFSLSSCSLTNTGPKEPPGSHFGCPTAP